MCPVGDAFGSRSCDCRWQLEESVAMIMREGTGVLLYVHPKGRTSIASAFESHVLHTARVDPAGQTGTLRDFGLGAQVLADLGVRKIKLLSNNPKKIAGIGGYGIEVVERVPIEAATTSDNRDWLRERREREGHLLSVRKAGE
jgi:3,4-dihydroxy 2-butanone 4-phosphate synthase/GTP cyclohydrolase II